MQVVVLSIRWNETILIAPIEITDAPITCRKRNKFNCISKANTSRASKVNQSGYEIESQVQMITQVQVSQQKQHK